VVINISTSQITEVMKLASILSTQIHTIKSYFSLLHNLIKIFKLVLTQHTIKIVLSVNIMIIYIAYIAAAPLFTLCLKHWFSSS